MKKLKLSLQNIEGVEVLTREQLKMVMGGDGGSGATGGMCWIRPKDQNGNPKGEAYAIFTSEGCPDASSVGNQECVNLITTPNNGVFHCSYNCC